MRPVQRELWRRYTRGGGGGGGQYPRGDISSYLGHLIRDHYTVLSGHLLRVFDLYIIVYIYIAIYRYALRAYVFFGARESGQVDI